MENIQEPLPVGATLPKSNKNKIVYAVVVVAVLVILGEAYWAYTTFQKQPVDTNLETVQDKTTGDVQLQAVQPEASLSASISLKSPKQTLKIGEKITVTAYVSSDGKNTDGTDLLLIYDPKVLSVETIGTDKKVMAVSDIYSEYPSNGLGEKEGVLKISGISNDKNGIAVDGVLGSIIFTAKAKGKTSINVLFSPDVTSESNVVETKTGKDLLGKVGNLEVEVK